MVSLNGSFGFIGTSGAWILFLKALDEKHDAEDHGQDCKEG